MAGVRGNALRNQPAFLRCVPTYSSWLPKALHSSVSTVSGSITVTGTVPWFGMALKTL
jgi:hypothetical protein